MFISKYLLEHYNIIHGASIVAVMEPKVEGYKDHFAQHEKTITKDKNWAIFVFDMQNFLISLPASLLNFQIRDIDEEFRSFALFFSRILVINLFELSFSKFKKWFLVSLMVQRRKKGGLMCSLSRGDRRPAEHTEVRDENLS